MLATVVDLCATDAEMTGSSPQKIQSCRPNAGQNQHLKIVETSFENASQCKNLGTIVTNRNLKKGVFWVVTPCGSCKNRRFRETWRLLHQGDKNR
jgi:hypothetical protein